MKFTWPWLDYVELYESDIKTIQYARVKNKCSVWKGVWDFPIPILLLDNGKWKEQEKTGYGYLGTWKPYKWIPPWKRPKLLELNKGAKRWQSLLDTSLVQNAGHEIIWGGILMAVLGALVAITLSVLLGMLSYNLFH